MSEHAHWVPIGLVDGYQTYAVIPLTDEGRERRYRKYVEHVVEQRKDTL